MTVIVVLLTVALLYVAVLVLLWSLCSVAEFGDKQTIMEDEDS